MYHVSAQGIDERMINVHYYYYYYFRKTLPATRSAVDTAEILNRLFLTLGLVDKTGRHPAN